MKPKPALAATFDSGILLPALVTSPPSAAVYMPLAPMAGPAMPPYAGEQLFFQAKSDAKTGVLTLTVSDQTPPPNAPAPDAAAPAVKAQLTVTYLGASMTSNQVQANWPGGPIDFSVMLNGDRTLAFLQFEPTAAADPAVPDLGYIVLEEDDPIGAARAKIYFISETIPVPKYKQRAAVATIEPAGGVGLLGPMGIDFGAPQ